MRHLPLITFAIISMTLTQSYTLAQTKNKNDEASLAEWSEANSAEYEEGGYEGEVGDNGEIMSQRKTTERRYKVDFQDGEYEGEILDYREDGKWN